MNYTNPYTIDSTGHKLHNLFFEVTQRCNALCDHCGSRCDSSRRFEIPTKAFINVLEDVYYNMGTDGIMLNITGGEPLMRKGLFDIADYANDLGFKWGLVTNGILINDKVIEKMKRTNMSTITISLDGMKNTHEEFRHVPKCFNKIIRGIKKLVEAGFVEHIQVTFIATKNNIAELPELYRLLCTLGIDSLRISSIDPIGRANDNADLMLDEKDFEFLFKFIRRHDSMPLPIMWSCSHYFGNTDVKTDRIFRKFACFTGIHTASVLSNGDIFGCPNIPRRKELIQGNVLEDSFSYVWENRFEIYRNSERTRGNKCKGCDKWQYCRGDSFHTFDFDKNEPKFCYKEIFKNEGINRLEKKRSSDEVLKLQNDLYGKLKAHVVKPNNCEDIDKVIFTPQATDELYSLFHYGKYHPINLYEQQVALIGNRLKDGYLIKYVIPSVLINRNENMAITNDFCLSLVLDEVDIINENVSKADEVYKDDLGKVSLLGFAHSHPLDTEFRFSIEDTKNHNEYVERFGDFISIILNPQKENIVCFAGSECKQAILMLLSK